MRREFLISPFTTTPGSKGSEADGSPTSALQYKKNGLIVHILALKVPVRPAAMSSLSRRLLGQVKSTLQIGNDYSVEPAGLSWRSNTFFIVSTVAVGLFTDLFLYGLVVPILPYMLQDRVGLPDDQVQSNVDGLLAAYAGASVLFSPVAGYIADKTSTRQAPFLLGLVALMLATLLLFLGTNMPVLVVARLLQGISGGFVWTIGLALCLETVGPENLGKTIGSVSSPWK